MASIECTFEEFKRYAREFHEAVGALARDELSNAWKCLGLAYLGMSEPMWQHSAAIVLQMETKGYLERTWELDAQAELEEAATQ